MKKALKISLILLVATVFAKGLSAQKLFPLQSAPDSVVFTVAFRNKSMQIDYHAQGSLFQPKGDFPQPLAIRLEDADLILEYQAGQPGASKSFSIELSIELPDGQIITPAPEELGDLPAATPGRKLKIWKDATERLGNFDEKYVLRVNRYLMGAVDCSGVYPVFSTRKRLPYYAAGSAGLVLVGLGQVFRAEKKDLYNNYIRRWEEGADAPPPTDNPLTQARQKQKAERICSWAGAGLIAIDAFFYIRKSIKIRKKQDIYNKFCGQSPSLQLQPSSGGLGCILQF